MSTRTQRVLGLTALASILTLLLPGIARAAIAVDDGYSTPADSTLGIAAPGILGNDDCETCAVISVNGMLFEGQISFGPPIEGQDPRPELLSGATLTVKSDGSFTYDPSTLNDPANTASDSFTYQAEDSRGTSAEATVMITLTEPPLSSPPVANDDQYSVDLGSVLAVSAPGVLGNDTDADGDPLTVARVNGVAPTFGSPIALSQGALTIQADGSFTYEPAADATAGADESFSYTASDGTASDGTELSNSALVAIALTESTTGDSQVNVRFEDVGFVTLASEIGRTEVDELDVAAAAGTLAQVGGAGLPGQSGALVLRNSVAASSAGAWEILRVCERMALLAQSQPAKYDLVVDIFSATPGSSFSVGGDGEVIVEISETSVRCRIDRVTG